ncbi:headcase protein-like [Dendronephthya gigantea]|uniref:headcase protein-like n=1 Tax=Dendronephthya gigantea TaxID=151771 RepID=UPI00106A2B74|nr:headcase protein-like [Dendronephthya gigantea]
MDETSFPTHHNRSTSALGIITHENLTMPFTREEKQKAKAAIYNGEEQNKDAKSPVENGHDLVVGEEAIGHECCYPKGCISSDSTPWNSVRFVCNNEQCDRSGFMHGECADAFEEDILAYLRSVGRARSWSDKQRRQNIWTKKGYDLIYKCCACSCGKGHLKKDLDYKPSGDEDSFQQVKSRRKKNKAAQKPLLTVSPNCNATSGMPNASKMHQRKASQSPPEFSPGVKSPNRRRTNSKSKDIFQFPSSPKGEQAISSSFPWRTDFATMVTILPRQKINPCHIKMDDDFTQSDDPRSFILKALFSNSQTAVNCVICQRNLPVFANYPLLDGTFFLSPKELTASGCIEMDLQSRTLYLTAVCMHCLQGKPQAVKCKFCNTKWDGSHHQIGTLYWYDIFAASPCCDRRNECRKCGKPVANSETKQFFSDYSRRFECPHCSYVDCHYVKPLTLYELTN